MISKKTDLSELSIVIAGWAGMKGASVIAKERKKELAQCFPGGFIERATSLCERWDESDLIKAAKDCGAALIQKAGEGGILSALALIGENKKPGMEITLRKIPICAEIVELCEFYELDPYYLNAEGAAVILISPAEPLLAKYEELHIPAASVGYTTDRVGRHLLLGENTGFLNRPQRDELDRFLSQQDLNI